MCPDNQECTVVVHSTKNEGVTQTLAFWVGFLTITPQQVLRWCKVFLYLAIPKCIKYHVLTKEDETLLMNYSLLMLASSLYK